MTFLIGEEDYNNSLSHFGILRKSGRYPWGSGGDVEQRSRDFLGTIAQLKAKGLSDVEVAKAFHTPDHPFTTTDLRAAKSIANNAKKQADISQAQRLKEKGMGNVAIGQQMKINESSVRALLAPGQKDKADVFQATVNMLKKQVDEKGFVDVGIGAEHYVNTGVSKEKLAIAVAGLKEQGYELHNIQIDQLGTTNKTTIKVLAPPGTTYTDIVKNKDKIQQITDYSNDGGRSYESIQYPKAIDSKRVAVRYAEQGGHEADGVVYVRPGVDDVSLGSARYAQVRISVDNTHFLKGMAMYKDDLPEGVDLMFNTNKSDTGNKLDAMKELKKNKDGEIDPDLPFGAIINRQVTKKRSDGTDELSSVMNIVNDEGDWENWSRSLSSQMLSKQSKTLVQQQLDMTYEDQKNELDRILSLTNPVVRQTLLKSFGDSTEAKSINLKAKALPNQKTHVILPINSLKETEVYAPNFNNGERVVLIRFPHGGKFEIPELTVNNKNAEGKKLLGQAPNAIGIHSKVAQHLSGADFDGDTVLVIPNNNRQIKTERPLEGLSKFDPIHAYPKYDGMPEMSAKQKGTQMGLISNLITDMTIGGANNDELARAVRHSMVVIDAEKHKLNYKLSAINNGIPQLMEKYQGKKEGGASTLISKSGPRSTTRVPEFVPRKASQGGPIDKATGKKVFVPTGNTYSVTKVNKRTGVSTTTQVDKKTEAPRLSLTDDAHTLSSGTVIEKIYGDHSNKLKALADQARKEMVNTKTYPKSGPAAKVYAKEVTTLNAKLNVALKNAPLERQAQLIANAQVSLKRQDNPDMESSELKKVKAQALTQARLRTGARKQRIEITDDEWDAIQAGAISTNELSKILANSDLDRVKELATPRTNVLMTTIKTQRAQSMLASGYTQAEVASALGVSVTTLKNSLAE